MFVEIEMLTNIVIFCIELNHNNNNNQVTTVITDRYIIRVSTQ